MAGNRISAESSSLMALLDIKERYEVGEYQREYTWGADEVRTLLTDLREACPERRQRGPLQLRPSGSQEYFLGPFVYYTRSKFDRRLLVDGQQRFVTLNLIFLHLLRLIREIGDSAAQGELHRVIRVRGGKGFSVGIKDHVPVLEAIADGRSYEPGPGDSLSRRNLWARSQEIESMLGELGSADEIIHFSNWLLNNVTMVAIRAPGEASGYRIFETMNDRGARLTPVDLLKSYLLSNARGKERELNDQWREMLTRLSVDRADHTAPARFVKAALQARYARIGHPGDLKAIEVNVNSWVRRNGSHLGLGTGDAQRHIQFVEELVSLADKVTAVLAASRTLREDYEVFWFNERNGMGAQLVAVLAAADPDDVRSVVLDKALRVARFLDRWYVLRVLDDLPVGADDVDELVYGTLVPALRPCRTADDVTKALGGCLDERSPAEFTTFGMRPNNRRHVHYLLARATAYVEQGCGRPVDFAALLDPERSHVEHVWSTHHSQVKSEIKNLVEFRMLRQRLGGLGLLPGSDNMSLQDMPLADKRKRYSRQNVLLAALSPDYNANNPDLRKFVRANGLAKELRSFGEKLSMRKVIELRQDLFLKLFTLLWDPYTLQITDRRPEPSEPARERPAPAASRRKGRATDLARMLDAEAIAPEAQLVMTLRDGSDHWATVRADATVALNATGDVFGDLNTAGAAVKNTKTCEGMKTWHLEFDGVRITVGAYRDQLRQAGRL